MQQGVIPESRWTEALALVYANDANPQALIRDALNRLRTQPPHAEGLLGIWNESRVLASIWIVRSDQESATIGTPGITESGTRSGDSLARSLWQLAVSWQRSQNIRWSQVLLTPADAQRWGRHLDAVGYEHPACLDYLHRKATLPRTSQPLPDDWKWQAAEEFSHQEILGLVADTFQETLDCPFLGEHRSIEQIVTGFRETGDTKDRFWQILSRSAKPVGCVLSSVHESSSLVEWTYVGLVPELRGQGKGAWLCQRGLQVAAQTGCSEIALAVDQANGPALRMYANHGFRTWDTRDVFVKWNWDQTGERADP